MITNLLAPLESAEYIAVSYRSGIVHAALSRLNLNFHINREFELECKQFPGMIVDGDQNFGTFIGLQNFLVVRLSRGFKRSVFVPAGEVLFEQHGYHTRVRIDTAGLDKVKYHFYTIDTILGRLVGNGSLTSHLYKSYLHAVTSHCHPDPLTRRTGTEEALAGLRSAATKSIQAVKADSVDARLFRLIAALTPKRHYYPVHLRRMQQVIWTPGLPPLAQHEEFCAIVKEISAYAGSMNIFEDVDGSIEVTECGDEGLSKRAAIRNAAFLPAQFGGSMILKTEDMPYKARDLVDGSDAEARVFYVATLVDGYSDERLNIHPNLLRLLEGLNDVTGVQHPRKTMRLGYDQKWLGPDMSKVWVPLYDQLRGTGEFSQKYNVVFFLSTLAYLGKVDLRLVETFLAFYANRAFRWIEPPNHSSYNLEHGYQPDIGTLSSTISGHVVHFSDSCESRLPSQRYESDRETSERRREAYNANKDTQVAALAEKIKSAWPCKQPTVNGLGNVNRYPLIHVHKVLEDLKPQFDSWNRNCDFRRHIAEVQAVLDALRSNKDPVFQYHHFLPCTSRTAAQVQRTIPFGDLLEETAPPDLPPSPVLGLLEEIVVRDPSTHHVGKEGSLEVLLRDFRLGRGGGLFRERYATNLEESLRAFHDEHTDSYTFNHNYKQHVRARLGDLLDCCSHHLDKVFETIEAQLGPRQRGGDMAAKAGLWPRASPMLLLQQLATSSTTDLPHGWKSVFVAYGVAITVVQRLRRLLRLLRGTNEEPSADFLKELENFGHKGWDPVRYPDWLLIEIENDFLIRPVQAEIANSMIAPPDNHNSIMQLLMGEGKTSVIVPIVAASLANGEKLVRVVVLRPLSGQMFQTLVQKLGGLVNRRIFFMPFSRRTSLTEQDLEVVHRLYEDCRRNRGILLVQPQHILSFKLVGLERLYTWDSSKECPDSDGNRKVARLLVEKQKWLEEHSRDILDESDEILNVRHELIYTIGEAAPIEHHPDRWLIIQEIFDVLHHHFREAQEINVLHFEVERHGGVKRFDSIRILNLKAGEDLLSQIGKDIINGTYSAAPTVVSWC